MPGNPGLSGDCFIADEDFLLARCVVVGVSREGANGASTQMRTSQYKLWENRRK